MLSALRVWPCAASLLIDGWLRCFLARDTFINPNPIGVLRRGCLGEAGLSFGSWGGLGRLGVRAGVRMGLGVLGSLEDDEESSLCDWNRLLSSSEVQSSNLTVRPSSSFLHPASVPSDGSSRLKLGRSVRCMSSSNRELLSSEAVR